MTHPLFTRRNWLTRSGCGFGALALAGLAGDQVFGRESAGAGDPLAARRPHATPRAKRVIFLFMQGGVSHVDSYDYKPALIANDGKDLPFDDARAIAKTGKRGTPRRVMQPLWKFEQHGESGRWSSNLFPETNRHVDDLCFLHGVHTEGVAHGPATLFLHCGATSFVRPSLGAWAAYGLGTENTNLPGFISISPSPGNGGARNFGNAFLPAVYQGTPIGKAGAPAASATIRNLTGPLSTSEQQDLLRLLDDVNAEQLRRAAGDSEYEAVVKSYELAARMQLTAPELLDLGDESAETLSLYGIDEKRTESFGRQCLLARRLCEAGVRFIQVTYGDGSANPAWDQHSNMPAHGTHAAAVDRPIAGLLADLKRRGLLEDTLVWFGSEFGRTPYSEGNGTGRDHNPGGFTVWLAGGGVKSGFAYGETDELGHQAVQGKVHMHDLHATILHLLGLDHERLTYRYAGRDFRLTDVHGRIVEPILA